MSAEGPSGDTPHTALPGDQRSRLADEGYVDSESQIEGSDARENFALWIAVLGSACVWFVQLQTSYSLVIWACANNAQWSLHVASLLFVLVAAVPGWFGWQHWAKTRNTERVSAGHGRRNFMALLGLLLTALFVLLIIAQAIPSFFINSCLE